MPEVSNALALTFDGAPLTFVRFNGSPVVVARELGAALGYADPSELPKMVRDEWAPDFIEGQDYHLLTGAPLARFKDADSGSSAPRVRYDPRAPSLLVLTESGLWMVATKTEKDLGVRFRRFLVDEVIPKLARGEAIGGSGDGWTPDLRRARELRLLATRLDKTDPARAKAMRDEAATVLGHPPVPRIETAPTDGVAAFIESHCRRGKGEACTARDLYAAYTEAGGIQSPKGFGAALARLGFTPRASNGNSRIWTGLTLANDPTEAAVLAWADGRDFTLTELRTEVGIDHDNRTLGAWLRRAGYAPRRAQANFRFFDKWRLAPAH